MTIWKMQALGRKGEKEHENARRGSARKRGREDGEVARRDGERRRERERVKAWGWKLTWGRSLWLCHWGRHSAPNSPDPSLRSQCAHESPLACRWGHWEEERGKRGGGREGGRKGGRWWSRGGSAIFFMLDWGIDYLCKSLYLWACGQ